MVDLHRQGVSAHSVIVTLHGPDTAVEFAQGRPNGSKTAKIMFKVHPYLPNRWDDRRARRSRYRSRSSTETQHVEMKYG